MQSETRQLDLRVSKRLFKGDVQLLLILAQVDFFDWVGQIIRHFKCFMAIMAERLFDFHNFAVWL